MMEWLQILHVFSYIQMSTFKHLECILQTKETQTLDTQEGPRGKGRRGSLTEGEIQYSIMER